MKKELAMTKQLVLGILTYTIGSSFYYGYNLAVINVPQNVVQQWINSTYLAQNGVSLTSSALNILWSIVTSIYAVGGIIGACMGSPLGKKVGRKNTLYIFNGISVVGAIMVGIAKTVGSYYVFMAGRFTIGIVAAVHGAVAPQYLTEVSPLNIRGAIGAVHILVMIFGMITAQIVGLPIVLGSESLWPLAFALTVVPSVCQVIMLYFCPESPRYLYLERRNLKQAEESLVHYRGYLDVQDELETLKNESQYMDSLPTLSIRDFFTKRYLYMPLMISVVMMTSIFLTGAGVIEYYSTQIFQDAGVSEDESGYATVGIGVSLMMGAITAAIVIDKLGRRLVYGTTLACLWLLSIALVIVQYYQHKVEWLSYLTIVLSILFMYIYAIGPGTIPWIFLFEVFLQNAIGLAGAISMVVNWFSLLIAGLMWQPLEAAANKYSFLVFTGILTFYCVFTFVCMPETRGRRIDDIVAQFARSRIVKQSAQESSLQMVNTSTSNIT